MGGQTKWHLRPSLLTMGWKILQRKPHWSQRTSISVRLVLKNFVVDFAMWVQSSLFPALLP